MFTASRLSLLLYSLLAVGVIVVIPIANVFAGALAEGVGTYWENLINDPDTLHSIYLTLTVVPIGRVCGTGMGIELIQVVDETSNRSIRSSTAELNRCHW